MYFAMRRRPFDCFSRIFLFPLHSRLPVTRPRQSLVVALVCFAPVATQLASAAGEPLTDLSPSSGDASARVKIVVEVAGFLKLQESAQDKKSEQNLPLTVAAELVFDERLVRKDEAGPTAIRYYQNATAHIRVGEKVGDNVGDKEGDTSDDETVSPKLRDDRRLLLLAQREGAEGAMVIFAPSGPLTREELDLVDVPGNSVFLDRLLPPTPVAKDETWEHADDLAAQLLGLDVVTAGQLQSQLVEISTGVAKIDVSGAVTGSARGAETKSSVTGHYHYNLADRQVTWLALSIHEQRAMGYAAPGLDVRARIRMIRQPVPAATAAVAPLADVAPQRPGENAELLDYVSSRNGFRLMHDRRWFIAAERGHGAVMRMVDSGDLIATCTISSLPKLPVGKDISLQAFQSDIQRALSQHLEQLLDASESTTPDGIRVLRVAAAGSAAKVPVRWVYYHLSNRDGRRLSYVFSLSPEDLDRFAAADELVTASVQFIDNNAVTR